MIVSETCLKHATCKDLPFFWVTILGLGWGRKEQQRILTHYCWLVYRGNACFATWSAVLWPDSCWLHIKSVPVSFGAPFCRLTRCNVEVVWGLLCFFSHSLSCAWQHTSNLHLRRRLAEMLRMGILPLYSIGAWKNCLFRQKSVYWHCCCACNSYHCWVSRTCFTNVHLGIFQRLFPCTYQILTHRVEKSGFSSSAVQIPYQGTNFMWDPRLSFLFIIKRMGALFIYLA